MPRGQLLFASAAIATAMAVSAPAQAATTFTGAGSVNITNGTGAFFDADIPAGAFADTIEFTVPSAGTSSVSIIYFEVLSGITDLIATFNSTPITFSPVPPAVPGAPTILAGGIALPVTSGTQVLQVSGFSNGTGSYSGNVVFSAVPEAATWLMMMAGVGFTGFALRRRKAQPPKISYAF